MSRQALIIFTKNPIEGKVKTRLAASIGNDAALLIYKQLLAHTVASTKSILVDKFVFYSDKIELNDIWDNENYFKETQQGKDLGERMNNAFAAIFNKGYDKIVIIGTDCPDLDVTLIKQAFSNLDLNDVIIGPAEDGGYYLLGMKQLHSPLFENIQWSTATVLNDTIERCISLKLNYTLMPVLNDIDEEKDLIYMNKYLRNKGIRPRNYWR